MSTSQDRQIIQAYLFFGGNCEPALEFYRQAIGAKTEMLMRYKESPEAPPPGMLAAGWEHKIMHASFKVGQTTVMASDGCGPEPKGFQGFSLSLTAADEADAERYFNALAEGGIVNMPLTKTFWSPRFGMLEDKFGIGWMVTVAQNNCGPV